MSEAVNALFTDSVSIAPTTPLSVDEKTQRYEAITPYISGLLADDAASGLALMSSVLSVLHNAFDTYFWTGFYRRVSEEMLEVGPNQGTVGCTSIRFGKGVCGTVAATQTTKIVADVHAEPNHIGCDDSSQSEIVVPLFIQGQLAGVLDVDSHVKAAFDPVDQRYLERFMDDLGQALSQRDVSGLIWLK